MQTTITNKDISYMIIPGIKKIVIRSYKDAERFANIAARILGTTAEELKQSGRKREYVSMRNIIMAALRIKTFEVDKDTPINYKLSFAEIGLIFNKDHATALHACKHHEERLDPRFYEEYCYYWNKIKHLI